MFDVSLEWVKTAGILLLASIAGGLGFARRELAMGRKLTFFRTLFAVLLAVFFAYLMTLVCKKFNIDDEWSKIIIGVVSFVGPDTTIQILEKIVLNKLGIKYGYFPVDTATKVPSTVGSTEYLRADVFATPVEARDHAIATATNSERFNNPNTEQVNK